MTLSKKLLFSTLASSFQDIETTSSRLSMTEKLAQLFKEVNANEIDKICYLSLGILAPKYEGLELQLAEKMMLKTIAVSLKIDLQKINAVFKETGDLGLAYQQLATAQKSSNLDINQVYEQLQSIAKDGGEGSQDRKINSMSLLLQKLDSLSGKFIVRMAVGKLRLGFSDMTIIDALSWMEKGNKSLRPELERAYNVRADIGQIASIFKQDNIMALSKIIPHPGTPIRPCKATPLLDPQEILVKMSGKTALEPKFDGFRVQIHLDKNKKLNLTEGDLSLFASEYKSFVKIFSRNLDDTTHMFPDLVAATQSLDVDSIILDGEAVAVDPVSGTILPFQETVKRKRKHNIGTVAKDIPLRAFIFDVLYLNGQSVLKLPFSKRRQMLEQVFAKINSSSALQISEQLVTEDLDILRQFFTKMEKQELEGLMAKKLDSPYKAGARDFTWVKYKLGMQADLADTVDVIVMGYFKGQGKWTQFGLGKLLVGILVRDKIISLSKVGSGLSEDNIKEMVRRCHNIEVKNQPKEYVVDKNLIPDVWVEPRLVIELRADSISKSPFYQTGLSLRFPRFIRFRDDKGISDATNLEELKIIAGE